MTQPRQLDMLPVAPDRVQLRPSNPVKQERQRLNAAAVRVLERLKATPGEWVSNVELSRPEHGGLAGIRRKWELEQEGHVIERRHVKGGSWEYRWMGLRGHTDVV